MSRDTAKLHALIQLLEDDDRHVSTIAMEQLLEDEQDADGILAEFQEASSPRLRSRIHQMGSILRLRRERNRFIADARSGNISLWEGILQINYHFNPRIDRSQLDKQVADMASRLPSAVDTANLAAFMRGEGFSFAGEDILGADLYLMDDVVNQRVGAPILLSVLARHLCETRNWSSTVVLYRGKHCLVDSDCNLIEPGEGWRISRLPKQDVHPCSNQDIWFTLLSQLFLAALMEGRLQAIHRVGSLLTRLCGGTVHDLPFPIGS